MKINVQVDLSEMFCEEGGEVSFNDQIKNSIIYQVRNEVFGLLTNQAKEDFRNNVATQVNSAFESKVKGVVAEIIDSGNIKKHNRSNEEVSLKDYIEETIKGKYFDPNSTAESVMQGKLRSFEEKYQKDLGNAVIQITKNLQDRYDMVFASQIIAKMKDANMLAPGMGDILLGNSKGE